MPSHNTPSVRYTKIWEVVEHIPKGRVMTYGAIAEAVGLPHQARLVGYALHNLPASFDIPWHRVVAAKGRIAFPKHSNAYKKQKILLEAEGIIFTGEQLDLRTFGWKLSMKKKREKPRSQAGCSLRRTNHSAIDERTRNREE